MFDKNRFKAQLALAGMNMKQVAAELGINESTMYRKFNANGDFSRSEINKMITILGIEKPEEIFFSKELA